MKRPLSELVRITSHMGPPTHMITESMEPFFFPSYFFPLKLKVLTYNETIDNPTSTWPSARTLTRPGPGPYTGTGTGDNHVVRVTTITSAELGPRGQSAEGTDAITEKRYVTIRSPSASELYVLSVPLQLLPAGDQSLNRCGAGTD